MLFGYFLHDAKSDNPFPCRELRGSTNLDSARRNGGFALTKLNPFAAIGGIIFCCCCNKSLRFALLSAAVPPFFRCLRHPSGGYAAFSVACGNNSCRFAAFRHSRLWHTPCAFLRPRRLFFPPYGGAMLLPQHFLPQLRQTKNRSCKLFCSSGFISQAIAPQALPPSTR